MERPPFIQPDVSVCTTVRKQPLAARALLRSLYETADPVALEIFLINLGTDSDETLSDEFPALKIFSLPAEQELKARNMVMELAVGRYILHIDYDAQVQPQCLLRLVEFMDDTPDAGMAVPLIINAYGKHERTARAFHSISSLLGQLLAGHLSGSLRPQNRHLVPAFAYDTTGEADWFRSGARIIRGELIRDIGLPAVDYPPYFSEMEYALRAKKAGWHNFHVHEAGVLHPNPLQYDPNLAGRPFSLLAATKFLKKRWLG